MDSLTIGLEPGSTAPASGSPHNLALLGAHHLAAVAVAISSDAVRLAGADGIGVEQEKRGRSNCAARSAVDQAQAVIHCDSKLFFTFRAQLALAGHALSRTDASDGRRRYFVSRWPLVHELRTLEEVRRFAQEVGVAS